MLNWDAPESSLKYKFHLLWDQKFLNSFLDHSGNKIYYNWRMNNIAPTLHIVDIKWPCPCHEMLSTTSSCPVNSVNNMSPNFNLPPQYSLPRHLACRSTSNMSTTFFEETARTWNEHSLTAILYSQIHEAHIVGRWMKEKVFYPGLQLNNSLSAKYRLLCILLDMGQG